MRCSDLDRNSAQPIYTCKSDVFAVSYADPSGDVILTGARDGRIRSWDTRAAPRTDSFGSHASIIRLTSSVGWMQPVGEWWIIAAAVDGSLRLFDRRKIAPARSVSAPLRPNDQHRVNRTAHSQGSGGSGGGGGGGGGTGPADVTESVVNYFGHVNDSLLLPIRGTTDHHTRTVFIAGTDAVIRAWDINSGKRIWNGLAFAEPSNSGASALNSRFGFAIEPAPIDPNDIALSLCWLSDCSTLLAGSARSVTAFHPSTPDHDPQRFKS